MELHNTNEDVVLAEVNDIFDAFEKNGNPEKICTCNQCRMDTVCYVLNRIEPRYILSNRGAVRIEQESIANQQKGADIVSKIYDGLRHVAHNKRPSSHENNKNGKVDTNKPVFNIPTIIGRLFNGTNFAPITDVKVELLRNGDLVQMMDNNWQNPYNLGNYHAGTFTFWPAPIPAEDAEIHRLFEFAIKAEIPGFETLNHFFKVPVTSELKNITAYSRDRTFKLSDLYLFPPGGEEFN
jgi:competence protein ComFB